MSPKAGVPPYSLLYDAAWRAVGVEEALQNQHGSHLIDDLAVCGGRAAGSLEMAVGFG